MTKWMVCGTRKPGYSALVHKKLDEKLHIDLEFCHGFKPTAIIEGCCPESADQYAEEWAKKNDIAVEHFPGTQGNYLKRNIEMVRAADIVIAFWDGYSYGTAHSIAWATKLYKPVFIVLIKEERKDDN